MLDNDIYVIILVLTDLCLAWVSVYARFRFTVACIYILDTLLQYAPVLHLLNLNLFRDLRVLFPRLFEIWIYL